MKKAVIFVFAALVMFSGCDAVSKLAKQGMAKAEEAAYNYVDKQAGTGSVDDYNALKGDKEKMDACLAYFTTLNKMADDQKITAEERDSRKEQIHTYYDEYKEGKFDRQEFDKKCVELTK